MFDIQNHNQSYRSKASNSFKSKISDSPQCFQNDFKIEDEIPEI